VQDVADVLHPFMAAGTGWHQLLMPGMPDMWRTAAPCVRRVCIRAALLPIVVTPAALQNLIPGDKGVEQEIVSGEVLDAGTTVTMRPAFSHPELMLPFKTLQEVR
jgi:hypothetical protein